MSVRNDVALTCWLMRATLCLSVFYALTCGLPTGAAVPNPLDVRLLPVSSAPGVLLDDEPRRLYVLPHAELGRWIVNALQLRLIRLGIGHHVQPELLPEVPGFIP